MNKKVLLTLLTLFMLFALLPFMSGNFVSAYDYSDQQDYYPMGCPIYEVSSMDNGQFVKVSCHSDFNEAKNIMKTNDNYVVRYANSYSPTKIVAMNSGIAVTYPGRTDDELVYIYQNMDVRDSFWKSTYASEHNEMIYIDTPTMSSSYYPYGAIKVNLKGFEGYMTIKNADLIPTQFLDNGWKIWLGGNNQYYKEYAYDAIIDQDYFMIVKDGNYDSLQYTYHYTYSKKHELCTNHSYIIDNAKNYLDAGMQKNVKYYSADGINFYSDKKLTKFVATVYNYYMYLPLRSTTNISASVFDSFLNKKVGSSGTTMKGEGQTFINGQNKYGANALLVYAMACHESGYGTSIYAGDRYNLFGWGAYDENPSRAISYDSIAQCVEKQMGENLRYYMDYDHSYYFGTCLGNKGTGFNVLYASDANWGAKIASIAYEIDKYANGNNGKLTDYNKYTVGLVNTFDPNIYTTSNGKTVLYTGRFGRNYQKDLTVLVLENKDNRYKIQSTNNVINGVRLHNSGVYEYDWDKSVGYIDNSYVTILNNKTVPDNSTGKTEATYKGYSSLRNLELTETNLKLEGIGIIQGIDINTSDKVKHEIIFTDLSKVKEDVVLTAENIDSDGYTLNDGYDYKYGGFSINISLPNDNILLGSYCVKLRTTVNDKVIMSDLTSVDISYRNKSVNKDGINYRITTNDMQNYRLEFEISSIPSDIDFKNINKKSARSSLASYDKININENAVLTIEGHAFIYYVNFDNTNNIKYEIYLVNSASDYVKLDAQLAEQTIDYKKELGSSFNLDHISFKAEGDISSLNGDYTIYLKIINGDYIDICELSNLAQEEFTSVSKDNKTYAIKTSNIRKRLMLSIMGE